MIKKTRIHSYCYFKEMGVKNAMMETAVQDVDENMESQDVKIGLEDMMPSYGELSDWP